MATAPLAGDGHVNISPKGRVGTLAVLDPTTVAYLDFGGSHAETIAHLRENGRIVLMWCAFSGPPTVVRVHGTGEPVYRDDPRFAELLPRFGDADAPGLRAIIVVTANGVSDSCGYAVPFMDYAGERDLHTQLSAARPTRSSPPTARPRSSIPPASTACPPCLSRFPCASRRSERAGNHTLRVCRRKLDVHRRSAVP